MAGCEIPVKAVQNHVITINIRNIRGLHFFNGGFNDNFAVAQHFSGINC